MGLLTILKKMKQKEREVRLLMLYPFLNYDNWHVDNIVFWISFDTVISKS